MHKLFTVALKLTTVKMDLLVAKSFKGKKFSTLKKAPL